MMDINCDLGEYERLSEAYHDAEIMPYISACNIACGGHAGNQLTMQHSVQLALKNTVLIGAHPSYPDAANFGRRSMQLDQEQLYSVITEQINVLRSIAENCGAELHHVKPHGALYNDAADDFMIAKVIVAAVRSIDADLKLYGQAHSALAEVAQQADLSFVAEGFVDRRYLSRHRLVPRAHRDALIEPITEQVEQARSLIVNKGLRGRDGQWLNIECDTLCLHGDHTGALKTAKAIYRLVKQHHINSPSHHETTRS